MHICTASGNGSKQIQQRSVPIHRYIEPIVPIHVSGISRCVDKPPSPMVVHQFDKQNYTSVRPKLSV